MAISLTAGGIPCQQITATLTSSGMIVKNYSVSLPVGVISYVTIPNDGGPWYLNANGECLCLHRESVSAMVSGGGTFPVLSTYSFEITNSFSSTEYADYTLILLRLS